MMEKIASKHEKRILESLQALKSTFPVSEQAVDHFTHEQILNLEMLTSRFAKLQYYLCANIFDAFFEVTQENVDGFSMIDKLNLLEKLGIISDAHQWREMRKARNIIEHEYPDNPLLIANTLNEIYALCPALIEIKTKIFHKINQII